MIASVSFCKDGDREDIMKEIECLRRISTYLHDYCDENCKKRGECIDHCGKYLKVFFTLMVRMWQIVDYGWNLETNFPPLHVSC